MNYKLTVQYLVTIMIFLAFNATTKIKSRYKILIERVEPINYEPSIWIFNITIYSNFSFDAHVELFESFDPVIGIRLSLIRNGSRADLIHQKIDYCNLMKNSNPVGAILLDVLKSGSNLSLTCPIKTGLFRLRTSELPIYKFPMILPEFPFEMDLDINKKQGGKKMSKILFYGNIKHM